MFVQAPTSDPKKIEICQDDASDGKNEWEQQEHVVRQPAVVWAPVHALNIQQGVKQQGAEDNEERRDVAEHVVLH